MVTTRDASSRSAASAATTTSAPDSFATRPSATPKRSVSFGPNSEQPAPTILGNGMTSATPQTPAAAGTSGASSTTSSSLSTPSSALKPALKAGTERRKLPPLEQYSHPDPLLRRLRLVDEKGRPINLREHFRGAKVVGFYFSSQWAGQPLKEYHKSISEFVAKHPTDFKVIYVSVDVDEQWYKAGVQGKPWVSMAWNDGSSMPTERADTTSTPLAPPTAPLYNAEDFLLAGEQDIDEQLARIDTEGTAYLRPFSRVHLAAKLNIIAAPTLCVYHVEKSKMLDWNVRMSRLRPGSSEETWERWSKGEAAKGFGAKDLLIAAPGTAALVLLFIIYWLIIWIGGEEYNIVNNAMGWWATLSSNPDGNANLFQALKAKSEEL